MKKSICLVLSSAVSDFRIVFAARWLAAHGYEVNVTDRLPGFYTTFYDAFIVSRPWQQMCSYIETCIEAEIPVIVDMDDDFLSIPVDNPCYTTLGRGCNGGLYHAQLTRVLSNVSRLVVTSGVLAERYGRPDAVVIQNAWDIENPLWNVRPVDTGMVTVGWAGTNTHREDFKLVLPALVELTRRCENVRVLVGGDPDIYAMLNVVNERQKIFYPGVTFEHYPIIPAQCDVWLAPLVDTKFNRAKSDIKLVEAGAVGIPWVASPLPQYREWGEGGMFATSPFEWFNALETLVKDPNMRGTMGTFGRRKAETRTSVQYGEAWGELVREVIG